MDDNPYRSPPELLEEERLAPGRHRRWLRQLLAGLFVGITHGSFVGAAVAVVLVLILLPVQDRAGITPYSFVQYMLSASIVGAVSGLLIGATSGVLIAATAAWTLAARPRRRALLPTAVLCGSLCGGFWAALPWLAARAMPSGGLLLLTSGILIGGLTGWFSGRTLRRALSVPS